MSVIKLKTAVSPLQRGDEVVIVAASSSVYDKQSLIGGVKVLESWGLRCRKHDVIGRKWGYLAGKDEVRYRELHPENPAQLIVFARGGWGAARLLEKRPKWEEGWLLGYSDATSLLLARLCAGFDGCIHGPLLTSLAAEPDWSKNRLKSLLFGQSIPDLQGESWTSGIATGPLVVANLTVASHLLGSRYIPNLKGSILVLEDIGEAPYRVDRMLTQWRLSGILKSLAGLAFGTFTRCQNTESTLADMSFNIQEVLKERSKDLGIPVIAGLPVGHCSGNAALPIGRKATLDGYKGTLKVMI